MKQKGRNRESEAKRKMQKSKEEQEQGFMMSGVEGPHQPKKYSFPSRSFGTKGENRCFKGVWFQQWVWLDYKEPTDSVVCFYCSQANQKNLIPAGLHSKRDESFITKRRIKTYLRSTMLQEHVHQDFTDTLNLNCIANEFCVKK